MRSLLFSVRKPYFIIWGILCFVKSYAQPTWSGQVAAIVYEHCAKCHHNGGIAPFSLTQYQDVVDRAAEIESSLQSGSMPPWKADPDYRSFAHQRVMSTADKNTVLQWIAQQTPVGDARFAPSVPVFGSSNVVSNANFVLTTPTFTIPSSQDVYRNFEIPSGLTAQQFIQAIEVVPGNSSVVHHVMIYSDSSSSPIDPNSTGGTGSPNSKMIFGYTPGSQPYFAPEGTGFKLDANTRIIVQIHYAPGSLGQTDSTQIRFLITPNTLREIMVAPVLNQTNITNGSLIIPPNTTPTFNQSYTIPGKAALLYVLPHMHRLGHTYLAKGVYNNQETPLVKIDDWDFHWQDAYIFPHPLVLQSGTQIQATAQYDNTTNNPDNPNNPPILVTEGEGTNNEMLILLAAFLPYQTGDETLIVDKRIVAKGATHLCAGQQVKLEGLYGPNYQYQWYKDGLPISNANQYQYQATTTGSYQLQIQSGSRTAMSNSIDVLFDALPDVSLTPNAAVAYFNNISPLTLSVPQLANNSYQWYLNQQAIPQATTYQYAVQAAGLYQAEVYNGCYALSNPIQVQELLGRDAHDPQATWQWWAHQQTLTLQSGVELQWVLLDLSGQRLNSGNLTGTTASIALPGHGCFLLQVTDNNGATTFVKVVN